MCVISLCSLCVVRLSLHCLIVALLIWYKEFRVGSVSVLRGGVQVLGGRNRREKSVGLVLDGLCKKKSFREMLRVM